jgi:hypothetical protein
MNQQPEGISCRVCRANVAADGEMCRDCRRAFERPLERDTEDRTIPMDLAKYCSQMFPWEQMTTPPRLIGLNPVWLAFALLLVTLVLLLAFLRTPLPSCWEISS